MVPLRKYLLDNTRTEELACFVDQAADNGEERPAAPEDVPMTPLVPAYVLSSCRRRSSSASSSSSRSW